MDVREGILEHIVQVREHLLRFVVQLGDRAEKHDLSKLAEPEYSQWLLFTPRLGHLKYGTPEYMQSLKEMKPLVDMHYAANRHHPEYFEYGVSNMNLVDLIEMVCDWKAAAQRNGSEVNMESLARRFEIDPQLASVLKNTLDELK